MGGETVVRLIHLVFQQMWEKGLVPQDCKDTILVSLFKMCDNYCGISLLSVFVKVFAGILLNHLLKYIAPMFCPESQCCFCPEGQWI